MTSTPEGRRAAKLNAARRDIILEGAWAVFRRDGLEGATMRAIAGAAGCTTGAIYPLFPSKEAIYAALLEDSLTGLRGEVQAAVDDADHPAERLRAGATAFLGYYRDRPQEVTLGLYLWRGIGRHGLTRDLDEALNARLDDTLNIFASAIAGVRPCPPAMARAEVAALFSSLIGTLVLHHAGRIEVLGADFEAVAGIQIDGAVARLVDKPSG